MAIETNITVKELMRLNPWIKSKAHARKILHDIKTRPSVNLGDVIARHGKKAQWIVS